jgi:hypothetical protein
MQGALRARLLLLGKEVQEYERRAMTKKKTEKNDSAEKKSTGKRKSTRRKKELDPESVRNGISKLVKSHAEKMTEAVIEEGEKGQLATVKYLFEVAQIFPPATDGSEATSEEDSLAKTLLDRLNIPDKPVVGSDEEDSVVIPTKCSEGSVISEGEEHSESEDDEKEHSAAE